MTRQVESHAGNGTQCPVEIGQLTLGESLLKGDDDAAQ
jgi:hypothetical protein